MEQENTDGYIKTTLKNILFKGKRIPTYIDKNGFYFNKRTLEIYAQFVDGDIVDLTMV